MTAAWLPPGKQTFVGLNGEPLVGGKLFHYIPGTDDLKDTWQDYDQVTLNDNPITLDERGQCLIFGTGNYRQRLVQADGTEVWDRNTTVGLQGDIVLAAGSIFGLTISNTPGHETTQISVALGQCRDSTNTVDIVLPFPMTKDLTLPWAPGGIQGGKDNNDALAAEQSWHVFVIYNPSSLNVDVLFSQSPTAPSLPNGYTLFRRIASLPILGGSNAPPSGTGIPLFKQNGNDFDLYTGNKEYSVQSGITAAQLKQFYVPRGVKIKPKFYGQLTLNPNTGVLLRVTDPDLGVPPAFGTDGQFAQIRIDAGAYYLTDTFQVWCDTFAQVYIQVSDGTAVWAMKSIGWTDPRGQ